MNRLLVASLSTAILTFALGTTDAYASNDYLHIPGVPGESLDSRYRDWIDVDTYSVSVVDQACAGFTVMKLLDTSSPILSASALSGVSYPSMTMHSVKPGAEQQRFLVFELTNVVIRSVALKESPSGHPMEQVVLAPEVIAMSYYPQDDKGGLGAPIQSLRTCGKVK